MKLAFKFCEPPAELEKDRSPILLLHGMLDSKESWNELAPRIANNTGRTVYWMDARNHGDSPQSEEFNFDVLSDDVVDFMDDMEIPSAVLVGTSMGGTTAMKIALESYRLVDKLVVMDTVPKPFPITGWKVVVAMMLMMEESLGAISEGADEETAKRQVSNYLRKKMPETSPMKNQELAASFLPLKKVDDKFEWKTNLVSMEKSLISSDELDDPLTGKYIGETMFLYGTRSYMKVDRDETLTTLFPTVDLVPIEGATHMVQFEEPEQFLDIISTFINL